MATKNRILELRAKFKDDASKNAKRVANALKAIGEDAKKVTESAKQSGDAFGGLATDLAKLKTQSDKLAAFGTIATELDRARTSVEKMESGVRGSAQELANLARQSAEASSAADRARGALAAEEESLRSNKAARDEAKQEIRNQKEEISKLEGELKKLETLEDRRVANPRDLMRADQLRTSVLPGANADLAKLEADLAGYRDEIRKNEIAKKALNDEARALSATERQFQRDVESSASSLRKQKTNLTTARGELELIEDAAQTGSVALGGIAANQQIVERATAKMNDRIKEGQRLLESYKKFATGSGDFADPQTAARLQKQNAVIRQSEADWKALETEVKRLAGELRGMSGDVTEQVNALNKMSGASRAAKDEYLKQVGVLHQLRGASQTTFGEWAQRAIPLVSSTRSVEAATNGLANASNNAAGAQGRLAPATQRTANALNNGRQGADAFSGALLGVGRNGRQALSYMERLRGEIIALTLSYVGFQEAVNQIGKSVEVFRTLESVQSRLGAVFEQDIARVAQEVTFLRGQADRLGISFAVLSDTYGKFAVAANAANFSQEATRNIFLAVAEAARVNKLSMDQMKGTFIAIEQIISKGKFTSEEVRRQLGDRLPGAFNILADAMGKSTAELDKMMSQGQLLSTESNLVAFANEMTRRFGPQLSASLDTLSTDIGRFENNVFKVQLALADGFVPALREALQSFDDFVNSAEGAETFNKIGTAVGKLLIVLGQVPEYFDEIALFAKVFISLNVAGVMLTLTQKALALKKAIGGVGQQMAFIGPQMQQMTFLQRTLGQSFAQSIANIDAYRLKLATATASTGAARTGILAMSTSLGIIRGAMLATANVARTMWVAIGGPVGIAVTALTFAVGAWVTSVDEATTALSEHQRQLNAVKEAYAATKDEAEQWSGVVKGVTLRGAETNLANLETQFKKRVRGISREVDDLVKQSEKWDDDFFRTQAQNFYGDKNIVAFVNVLGIATEQFREGAISADEYRSVLDDLGRSTQSSQLIELLTTLESLMDEAEGGEDSIAALSAAIAEQRKVIRALNGDTSAFNDTTEETVEKTEDITKVMADFEAATRKIKGEISQFSEEMQDLEDIDALNKMYQDALKLVRTMDQAVLLTNLYNMALKEIENRAALRVFDGAQGSGGYTAALIKQFEDFQPAGKWDVNAYRAGYGSDTVTLHDGTIKKITEGMRVSVEDANRDLARRLVEFQNVIKGQIGETRFAAFGEEQQAVLTSIAYNYGSLPDRIVEAIRTGTVPEIADAIRGLGGDNNGINEGRRNQEATIFGAGGNADFQTYFDDAQDYADTLKEQQAETEKLIAQNQREIEQQRLINAGKEREAAIEAAIADARQENPNITDEQLAKIREQNGLLWDMQNATRERELAEERVNQLYTLRQQLLEQQRMAEEQGDVAKASELRDRLMEVNGQLREAIQSAIAMWRAVGGPEADAAIAKLDTMAMSLSDNSKRLIIFGLNMNQVQSLVGGFVDGLVGAIDSFAQKIAEGQKAVEALWTSFLQFAADFLRQIALMIIKQIILNALAGFGGPIGVAATALGGMTGHTGGVVGTAAIGGGNQIGRPIWAHPSYIYHTGGIAGLAPDEVSATLRKGEEILTEDDPRHRDNLGGASTNGDKGMRFKQVLAIGDKEIAQAMQGSAGEDVTITHIKRNAAKIRRLLGGNG